MIYKEKYRPFTLRQGIPSRVIAFLLFLTLLNSSCKKEIENKYVYGVDKVTLKQPGSSKDNLKSTTEFISIAYSDLFGISISSATLLDLANAYSSFGDKKLVEEIIIKNFLNSTAVQIPASTTMRNDVPKFVEDCYKKFYNRYPGSYEKWYMSDLINKDATIIPEQVYYSFMTSNEYRYY